DRLIQAVSAHAPGLALALPGHSQWVMTFADVVEVLVLFASAPYVKADHAQRALATFDQRPQQITARRWLIHLARRFCVALKLQLRFVKQFGRDNRRSFTHNAFALRAITAPGLQLMELALVSLAIFGNR